MTKSILHVFSSHPVKFGKNSAQKLSGNCFENKTLWQKNKFTKKSVKNLFLQKKLNMWKRREKKKNLRGKKLKI